MLYSGEEFYYISQRDTFPIGKWPASSFYVDNPTAGTRAEDEHPENHFFEFYEDGTFAAHLDGEIQGIWDFEDLDFHETSIGDYWEMDYLLTYDGWSEPLRIHIEFLYEPAFYINIPHPEKEGYTVVAGFQQE